MKSGHLVCRHPATEFVVAQPGPDRRHRDGHHGVRAGGQRRRAAGLSRQRPYVGLETDRYHDLAKRMSS